MGDVFRHRPSDDPPPISHGDPERMQRIEAHVEAVLGPVESVFHEIVSPYVHIDVLQVRTQHDPPGTYLVTSGMSELPMAAPEGVPDRAELVIVVPPEWPTDQESWQDERHYWPIRQLKLLARLPHEYGTWLGHGHTIPNDDPPQPYAADTELCGAMILPPLATEGLGLDDVTFYGVYFLHAAEMDYKLEHGADALLDLWEQHPDAAPLEVVDKARPSPVPPRPRRRGLFRRR